jgi:tetratricopeptide (TPR) repeat protein
VGAFRRAWAINEEIGAGPAQPFVLVGLAYASLLGGDLAGARQAVEEGLTRQRLLSETATNMAFLLANLARVQAHAGQLPAALATARAAAGITGQDRSPTGVWALRWQADLLRLLGCLDEADRLADEALKQAGEIGFQAEVALAHQSLGQNALVRGDLVAARQHLGVAARAARQSGGWYEVGEAYLALGDYWLAAGRPARTLALARRTERKTRAGGAVLLWLQALVSMGHAWLALGGPERAAEPLAEALARAEANGLPILVWRAAAALAQADPGRAGDCLERAWAAVEQVAAQVADAALRRSFLASPEVRRIAEQRERLRRTEGRRQRVVLSGATGQPVPVVWLADAGQADDELLARAGKVALRRARLLRLLAEAHAQGATPTQAELARVLEVSDRTVRSDLAALRGPGREPAG